MLRGPQGTLYGAGSLGGALRLIPNSPQLNTFAGSLEAGGSRFAHSDGTGYTVNGMLNLPVGYILAFLGLQESTTTNLGLDQTLSVCFSHQQWRHVSSRLANPSGSRGAAPPYTQVANDWNWAEDVQRAREPAVQAKRAV